MRLMTSTQAAEALGISKATLYAYVSRGLLESVEGPERSRRYRWEDIERLRLRKVQPREAAGSALFWGLPSLDSRICTIEQGRLCYRGRDAVELAEKASLEQVAALLWTGSGDHPLGKPQVGSLRSGPFLSAALSWLADQLQSDPSGWDRSPNGMMRLGGRIFSTFLRALPAHPRLRQALILCADHELNPSTFAARVAASTGSSLYAVICSALGALSGPRHGGACDLAEALWSEAAASSPRDAIARRLRRGDPVLGFGHRLYPEGDPRARALLEGHPQAKDWVEAGRELLGAYPSLDLALVSLELPPGGAFAVFATGRTLGWVAHALEQNQDERMIRPRANFPSGRGEFAG